MSRNISQEQAFELLKQDAEKIKQLINLQQNHMCIAECKAFEEVVDTQMYGYSKQIDYATRIGVLKRSEGQKLLSDLEREINVLYNSVFDEHKDRLKKGKEDTDFAGQK